MKNSYWLFFDTLKNVFVSLCLDQLSVGHSKGEINGAGEQDHCSQFSVRMWHERHRALEMRVELYQVGDISTGP